MDIETRTQIIDLQCNVEASRRRIDEQGKLIGELLEKLELEKLKQRLLTINDKLTPDKFESLLLDHAELLARVERLEEIIIKQACLY